MNVGKIKVMDLSISDIGGARMLSEKSFKLIADVFIGDIDGYFSYKTGPKLVAFFNERFGFKDVYQSGFPSRWAYVVENLNHLWNAELFDDFLTVILSKRYIMQDGSITEIKAIEKISSIIDKLNEELVFDGYKISKIGDKYALVFEDHDLEFIGEGGFASIYLVKSSGQVLKKLKDEFLKVKRNKT